MISFSGILDQVSLASVLACALAFILTLYLLDDPHWRRKFAKNIKDHRIRSDLIGKYYQQRPLQLYSLVPHLALRVPIERRTDRFRLRAQLAANLPEPLRASAEFAARQWIETVGNLAQRAAATRVDLRPFLGTYHLGIVREGAIAVPIAMSMMAGGRLAREDIDRLSWGLTLVELAVTYNSRVRQQREHIYFTSAGHEPPIGPILRAPTTSRRKLYDFIEFFGPSLRLPRWGRWRWERWLRGIDLNVSAEWAANN